MSRKARTVKEIVDQARREGQSDIWTTIERSGTEKCARSPAPASSLH
jgi:hypothetical protein